MLKPLGSRLSISGMLIHVGHKGEARVFGPHLEGSFLSLRGRLEPALLGSLALQNFCGAIVATILFSDEYRRDYG